MSTTFNELSDPFVVPQRTSRPLSTHRQKSEDVFIEDSIFSSREVQRFQEEDAEAARTISSIMSTLFTISVVLALIVVTWTYTRGLS